MPIESEITAFEDRQREGEWRVEYFDDDGVCYATVFAGPEAERGARDYAHALKAGVLAVVGPARFDCQVTKRPNCVPT
jgi:hypothetical protein